MWCASEAVAHLFLPHKFCGNTAFSSSSSSSSSSSPTNRRVSIRPTHLPSDGVGGQAGGVVLEGGPLFAHLSQYGVSSDVVVHVDAVSVDRVTGGKGGAGGQSHRSSGDTGPTGGTGGAAVGVACLDSASGYIPATPFSTAVTLFRSAVADVQGGTGGTGGPGVVGYHGGDGGVGGTGGEATAVAIELH